MFLVLCNDQLLIFPNNNISQLMISATRFLRNFERNLPEARLSRVFEFFHLFS